MGGSCNPLWKIVPYTPDSDSSAFWYDTKGRLFASQNKEQRTPTEVDGTTLPSNRYSYTKYDGLGRIIEVGEQSGTNMASILNNSFVQEGGIIDFFTGGIKKSITKTYYDSESFVSSHPGFIELQGKLDHLRKRVVSSTYQEEEISPIEQATYYSYDLMGNVKSIWQQVSGLTELKKTDYQFDLASGKTTAVLYQDGKSDAFYHQYEYDGENRIKSVYTNTQKAVSAGLLSIINTPGTQKDASYQYYLHGPLSRTELGGNLQGMDYSYTIHGWLKAMNGQDLNPLREMGRDGESGSGIHAGFSRDVLAYSLGYYIDDYAPINGSTYIRSYSYFGVAALRGISLFNGHINYSTVANKGLGDGPTIMAGIYSYHQLYTLAHRDTRIIPAGTTSWSDKVGSSYKYCERFGKDINGNLVTIIRSGDQNVDQYKMDDLRLIYDGNRLVQVKELYENSGLYSNDMEHQEANNYAYDKIGNLVTDVQEGITGIFWNVYGKIREIRKGSTVIKYRYDAAGNRVYKEEVGPGVNNATWYVRDAQGNTLATYEGVATPTIKESYIYGSSRLGSYSWNIGVGTPARTYEISNYLGNVMATIGDGQIPRMNGSLIDYYDADIKTATDYYSYGMVMPGRSFNSGTYRYGFNGQEMSNEIKGVGNSYTAEFWEYDPRLGRRWNIDPVNIGEISPYQTFANNPIIFVDPYGLDTVNSSRSAQVGDVFQHRNKNSNFYWNKTEEGWEGGGSSENLAGVTVTAKIKGGGTNYLNYPSSTKRERMQWDIDQRNYRLGDFSNLTQSQIARYQSWDKAESDYRSLSYIFVGGIAAPLTGVAAVETGLANGLYQGGSYLVKKYGSEFTYRLLSKAAENGGDFSKVDFSDVLVSTVNPFKKVPGGNYLTELSNSLVDFKNGRFQTVLNGKSATDIIIDASVGGMKARLKINYSSNRLQDSQVDFLGSGIKHFMKQW